jgi:phosphoribosyl 1,2-cyclic phosphodiesterase
MRVLVLGSGSSGNALLIEARGTRVLVEAGINPKVMTSRLAELGAELGPGEIHGIVASHHHGDHFGHADALAAAYEAPLYLHPGLKSEAAAIHRYAIGTAFRVGALTVTTVQVPHDAMQVALRIDDGHHALGIATDVGRVTNGLVGLLAECDAALVEANHCSEMLAFSEYPDVVKRRIGGGYGHLSNGQAADLAGRLVGSRLGRLWLGHLSQSNNTPNRALETVTPRARRIEVGVLPSSSPLALDIRSTRPHQLGLPFS